MLRVLNCMQTTYDKWNDDTRDTSLTDYGKRCASLLTGQYDVVICSTLRRARQTLDYSQITYGNLIFSDLCREILSINIIPNNLYNGEVQRTETAEGVSLRIQYLTALLIPLLNNNQKILIITHPEIIFKLCNQYVNSGQSVDFKFNFASQSLTLNTPPTTIQHGTSLVLPQPSQPQNEPTPNLKPTNTTVNGGFQFGTQATPQFGTSTQSTPQFGTSTQSTPQFGTSTQSTPQSSIGTQSIPQSSIGTQSIPPFGTQSIPQFGTSAQKTPQFGTSTQTTQPSFPPKIENTSTPFGHYSFGNSLNKK